MQLRAGQNRTRPSSKVFGSEVLLRRLAEVVVDVGRIDCVMLPFAVDILKQFVTGDILAALNDLRQPSISDIHRMSHAALSLKFEGDSGSVDSDMFAPHRSQSIGLVLFCILDIPDPN